MKTDPYGLGYTRHGKTLSVHYPKRAADGSTEYGAGFPFDHRPETLRNPASARSVLWLGMLGEIERESSANSSDPDAP